MVWILAAMLVAIGLYFIIRKSEVARGESLVMGGTLPPGCAVVQGILLIAMGVAFVIWYQTR
jgi:hypothetical protein